MNARRNIHNSQSVSSILPSFKALPSDEQQSPPALPTPTTPKYQTMERPPFINHHLAQTSNNKTVLFTKFSNDGVFYAGEKLSCTFTFVPPGFFTVQESLGNTQEDVSSIKEDKRDKTKEDVNGFDDLDQKDELARASDIQKRLPGTGTTPSPKAETSLDGRQSGILDWIWPFGSPVQQHMLPETVILEPPKPERIMEFEEPSLALAFVQLVGYLSYEPALVRLSPETESTRKLLSATGGAGASLAQIHDFILETKSVPVLVSSPSVLFANLQLSGHKKRTFEYEAILPPILPPTHFGKAVKIQYRLVIGIQRTIYDKPHFIRLPFRVFGLVHGLINNYLAFFIVANGAQTEYLSTEPAIIGRQDFYSFNVEDERELWLARKQEKKLTKDILTMMKHGDDEIAYQQKNTIANLSKLPDNHRGRSLGNVNELVSNCQQKLSFDICKNNLHLAHLKLSRSVFRLGEVINASLNFQATAVRCLQVSVFLECLENVSADLMTRSKADTEQLTKRIVSEQHENCLQLSKMPISLCIPTSASPEFTTDLVQVDWQIRIEFITQRGSLPLYQQTPIKDCHYSKLSVHPPASPHKTINNEVEDEDVQTPSVDRPPQALLNLSPRASLSNNDRSAAFDGFRVSHAVDQLPVESFDCTIPVHVYPCDWENGKIYPHRQKFVMVTVPDENNK